MEYTRLPHIGTEASRIGLGTWAIGGWLWGGTDTKNSIETILHAYELGINVIDTAPVYGFGLAEELVGQAMEKIREREKIILATKTGISWNEGRQNKVYRDTRRETIFREIDISLKRLKTDYIDVYFVHWPDPKVEIQEVAEAMLALFEKGKIRAIGVSNYSKRQMETFQKYAPLHVSQPPFNLYEREIEDVELPYCQEKGIATFGYGSLCRGLLSGKMKKEREFEGDDIRKIDPKFQSPHFDTYLNCSEKLKQWSQTHYQRPLIALAIRWMLDKGISTSLLGGRHPSQLDDVKGVLGWNLKESDFEEIDSILNQTIKNPISPKFMAPPSRDQVEKTALK